jgi:hypothetical protein
MSTKNEFLLFACNLRGMFFEMQAPSYTQLNKQNLFVTHAHMSSKNRGPKAKREARMVRSGGSASGSASAGGSGSAGGSAGAFALSALSIPTYFDVMKMEGYMGPSGGLWLHTCADAHQPMLASLKIRRVECDVDVACTACGHRWLVKHFPVHEPAPDVCPACAQEHTSVVAFVFSRQLFFCNKCGMSAKTPGRCPCEGSFVFPPRVRPMT